jgi:hypothetical protein
MRDSTKDTLRSIAFFFGALLSGIGVILIALGGFGYNAHLKEDAEPVAFPVSLSGAGARVEFTATKKAAYQVSLTVPVPPQTLATWDKCPESTYSDPGAVCPSAGQLKTEWSIADTDDSQWHDWERAAPVEYDTGYGKLGWFQARVVHRYIVTVRAVIGDAALRGATAHASAYLSEKGDQLSNAFGNLWSTLALLASVPFFIIGLPLLLIGRRRKRANPEDAPIALDTP